MRAQTSALSQPAVTSEARRPISRRLVWLLLSANMLATLGVTLGGTWDVVYHQVIPADTFLTPPHLAIYGGMLGALLVSAVAAGYLALEAIKSGTGIAVVARHPIVAMPLIANAGFLAAGPFDAIWHSLFGRDKLTVYTVPHATLTIFLTLTALAAVAQARWLRAQRPAGGLIQPRDDRLRPIASLALGLATALVAVTIYNFVGEWEAGASASTWVRSNFWLAGPVSALIATFTLAVQETCFPGARWWVTPLFMLIGVTLQKAPNWLLLPFGFPNSYWLKLTIPLAALGYVLIARVGAGWPRLARWAVFGASYVVVMLIAHTWGMFGPITWLDIVAPIPLMSLLAIVGGTAGAALGSRIERLTGDTAPR
jgi:hypothetical protein